MSGAVFSLYSYNTNGIDSYFSWLDPDRLKLKCSPRWYFDTNTRNITLKRNTFYKFSTIWLQYYLESLRQNKRNILRLERKNRGFPKRHPHCCRLSLLAQGMKHCSSGIWQRNLLIAPLAPARGQQLLFSETFSHFLAQSDDGVEFLLNSVFHYLIEMH